MLSGLCRQGKCSRRCAMDDPCPGGMSLPARHRGRRLLCEPDGRRRQRRVPPIGAQCNRPDNLPQPGSATGLCEPASIRGRAPPLYAAVLRGRLSDWHFVRGGYCVVETADFHAAAIKISRLQRVHKRFFAQHLVVGHGSDDVGFERKTTMRMMAIILAPVCAGQHRPTQPP